MSNIYHTEPPTLGKVLLHTTFGDVDIELWPKEAPLACRNFIQLALEGYYDGCLIHRIIKDFMIQMGEGDQVSIWGRPFKDELHGRIKFNHRGQVAVANDNKPNSNGSQFFITLAPCEWLDRKHTIFGKVTGNTIFNVLRLGEVDVDSNDKPLDTFKITRIEILANPFDDIIPRNISKKKSATSTESQTSQKQSRKGQKDLKLLSFGEEEAEEAVVVSGVRMSSSHDSKLSAEVAPELREVAEELEQEKAKKRKAETKARAASATHPASGKETEPRGELDKREDSLRFEEKMRQSIQMREKAKHSHRKHDSDTASSGYDSGAEKHRSHRDRKKARKDPERGGPVSNGASNGKDGLQEAEGGEGEEDMDTMVHGSRDHNPDLRKKMDVKEKERVNREFLEMKQQLMRSRKAVKVLTGVDAEEVHQQTSDKNLFSYHQEMRKRYLQKKRVIGDRQDETLNRLQEFQNKLRTEKNSAPKAEVATEVKKAVSYHGQVLEKDSDEEEEVKLDDWHLGKLRFRKKHIDDQYRLLAGDGRKLDDYQVIDSRGGIAKDPMSLLSSIDERKGR